MNQTKPNQTKLIGEKACFEPIMFRVNRRKQSKMSGRHYDINNNNANNNNALRQEQN